MRIDQDRILITGGTGSLGTAFIEYAEQMGWVSQFTVLARSETRMAQFIKAHPHVHGEIGDVRELDWLRTVVPGHRLVIHAAAIKQVPTAESNVREAMMTNVLGSQNIAAACIEAGVERVIGISTDKACAPHTTYGATKYLMEGLFREANTRSSNTNFILVRYGNVLRSNASVVPLFERQIAEGKPFTVTDPDMTRFWLTMDQAIELIWMASSFPTTGIVIVPRPPAMTMKALCHALDPNREIVVIGARSGEKKHEMLINESEALHTQRINDHFVIYPPDRTDKGNLPFGYKYSSEFPERFIQKDELYKMLNSYNPYGGVLWN